MKNSYIEELKASLEDLQVKQAFQEDLLNSLNEIIARQDMEIQKLWEANRLLKNSMNELKADNLDGDAAPPPHY